MQVTKLPTVPGNWVVEAETGAGGAEEKGCESSFPFHPGGAWWLQSTLSILGPLLEVAWSPLSRGSFIPS